MILKHGVHLAYCTNVHRGESWSETFAALKEHTLRVKDKVQPRAPYAIGLRLSDLASRELADPPKLREFQRWLDQTGCYVFTINGFPFGQFHDTRVKENVYLPDWTDPRRLEYTKRLFDLLVQLVPVGVEGSVSTVPGSLKDFITAPQQERLMRDNFWRCLKHVATLSERHGRSLHLGVEPEPFGWFENSAETLRFFELLRAEHPRDPRLDRHLGVNYDTCHFAIEFESPAQAIAAFQAHGIRISKIHLSNAIRLRPTDGALRELALFQEEVYLHQVIVRSGDGCLTRFRDLHLALASPLGSAPSADSEWRVHFHVPLHWQPTGELQTTADHVTGLLATLEEQPGLCSHLEMETYTWGVLPEGWRSRDVVAQIVDEYDWTLHQLGQRGFC